MGLSQLPREMVAAIADHLGPQDLTACSGVSIGWRQAFNLDPVWRPHCSLEPSYFNDNNNHVKPGFEVPFVEGSQLDPLCEWRIAFLKEQYIMCNWRAAQFTSSEVELCTNNCLYAMDAIDHYQNHWMFLCCAAKEGLKLEVWNVKGKPVLQMSTKMRNLFKNVDETVENNVVNFKLHLSGEKLLFIYDNLVTVFDFSFPNYRLTFLYNFSFVHTAPFFSPRRITHLPEGSLCEVTVLGNLLFGVSYSNSDLVQQFSPSVHVWNLDKAIKIRDHCVFEPRGIDILPFISSLVLTSGCSDNLVITRTFDGDVSMASRVRIFDKTKCAYSQFYVQLKHPIIWAAVAKNVIVVCELANALERDCVFHFYETSSTSCLMKTTTFNIYDPEKISSSNSKFAFIDLNSTVSVFDICTQQVYSNVLHPSRNRLKTITMINDHLLLLESKYRGTSRSFDNVLVTSYEVWDIMKRTKPLRLEQCFRSMIRTKFTFVKHFRVPPKLLTIVHPLYRYITVYVNSFW